MLRIPFLFPNSNNNQLESIYSELQTCESYSISNDSNPEWRFHVTLNDFPVTVHRIHEDAPAHQSIPNIPRFEAQAEEGWFKHSDTTTEAEDRVETFIEILEAVYLGCEVRPAVGYAVTEYGKEIVPTFDRYPADRESLAKNQINYTTWITIFPPALVDTYGRDILLDAPAWQTKEWGDGTIVLISGPNLQYPNPLRPIDEHLGLDMSLDDY